jgi:hypothetical protein
MNKKFEKIAEESLKEADERKKNNHQIKVPSTLYQRMRKILGAPVGLLD